MVTRKPAPAVRAGSKPGTRPAPMKRKAVVPPKPAPKAAPSSAPKPPAKVVAAPAKALAEAPKVKHKLVRDSFTIPKIEYVVIDELKQRATRLTRPTKKGELLRAGIAALNVMSDAAFLTALSAVPSLKTGRPKKVKVPAAKATRKKA